jgi:hypothetical protein
VKGLLLVLLAGLGLLILITGCDVQIYAYTVQGSPSPQPVLSPPAISPPPQRARAQRSPEDERWIRRMNAACVRRNARLNAVKAPASAGALGQYVKRIQRIYREHNRKAGWIQAPRSYEAGAQWVRDAGAAREQMLEDVFRAAASQDITSTQREMNRFDAMARETETQLIAIGVRECAKF